MTKGSAHVKKSRYKRRDLLRRYKDQPCADCGVRYPYYVMDFDHVRGEKFKNLSQAWIACVSLEKLLAEVAKCDVVCSNCHRERTERRRVSDNDITHPLYG